MRKFRDKDCLAELQNNKDRDRFYKNKMSDEQKEFFGNIKSHIFTFCEAGSGTGKTTVSLAAGLDLLGSGEIDRIVYLRTPSDRILSWGYLPGDLDLKTAQLWQPCYQALETLGLQPELIRIMEEQELLVLTTDSSLRGITINNSLLCLDEVQNTDYFTLKLIYSRCTDDCHVVTIGDRLQSDNKKRNRDYLRYCEYLAASDVGCRCQLTKNYRGRFSTLAEQFSLD